MEFKYITTNELENFSLHDCLIENIYNEQGELTFQLSHVDVLESNSCNKTSNAKTTNEAEIIFLDYNIHYIEINYFEKDTVRIEKPDFKDLLYYLKDTQILQCVDIIKYNSNFLYYFLVDSMNNKSEQYLLKLIIDFNSVIIRWNKYDGDAWFVRFQSDS